MNRSLVVAVFWSFASCVTNNSSEEVSERSFSSKLSPSSSQELVASTGTTKTVAWDRIAVLDLEDQEFASLVDARVTLVSTRDQHGNPVCLVTLAADLRSDGWQTEHEWNGRPGQSFQLHLLNDAEGLVVDEVETNAVRVGCDGTLRVAFEGRFDIAVFQNAARARVLVEGYPWHRCR